MSEIQTAINLMRNNRTHKALARDAIGNEVTPDDPSACTFCAIGALAKAFDLKAGMLPNGNPSVNSFYYQLRFNPVVTKLADKLGREPDGDPFPAIYSTFDWEEGGPELVIAALQEIEKEEA